MGEGDLLEVELTGFGVGGEGVVGVGVGREGVVGGGGVGVEVGVATGGVGGVVVVIGVEGRGKGFFDASPVIGQGPSPPLALELHLALRDGLGVVKIKGAVGGRSDAECGLDFGALAVDTGSKGVLFGKIGVFVGLFLGELLLLDHLFDELIDDVESLLGGHTGEVLE